MPKKKENTYNKILPIAKKEFLEKGFELASMRTIADAVGMSAAGIYRHFKDKEDLFTTLVQPALDAVEEWMEYLKGVDYQLLKQQDFNTMWEKDTDLSMITEVVYPHFEEFKLLLCCSEGTKYSDFLHEIILMEQKETELYLKEANKLGVKTKEVKSEELHLLMSAYVKALFEVVIHDFTFEDATHYLYTLHDFFIPGWRAILGI